MSPAPSSFGGLTRIDPRPLDVRRLIAGAGVDAKALKKAVFRAANLPIVEAA